MSKKFAHHIQLDSDIIQNATVALLPGDPGRVPNISKYLNGAKEVANSREFCSHIGHLDGIPLLVTSTGCGGPSLSICVEELAQIGVRHFIRVGTTGSIQDHIEVGDLVISNAAVRLEGASRSFAPIEYPAVSDFHVTQSLIEEAKKMGVKFHIGITASTDTFYQGQERYDSYTGYVPRHLQGSRQEWTALKVSNFEMEAATLFTMCATMGLKAGAICGVVAKRTVSEQVAPKEQFRKAEDDTIQVAIAAAKSLAAVAVPV